MRSWISYKWLPTAAVVVAASLVPLDALAQYRYPPPYPYYGGGYVSYDADLRISIKPNDAGVYVDGYFAGQVDDFDGAFQRLRLEPGQHEIIIYLAGHRTITEHLYFSSGQTRKISGTLEPLAPGEPDPGPPVPAPRERQEPPDTRRAPPPRDGAAYPPPPPDRGAPPPITPDRRPDNPGNSRFGTLVVRVDPGEAEIVVDGERSALGASSERRLIQLTDGRHLVEVNKPGYRRFSTEVDVRAGETRDLNVSLTRER